MFLVQATRLETNVGAPDVPGTSPEGPSTTESIPDGGRAPGGGGQRAFRLLLIQRAAVLPIRDRSASILCMYPKQKQKWFAVQQSQLQTRQTSVIYIRKREGSPCSP